MGRSVWEGRGIKQDSALELLLDRTPKERKNGAKISKHVRTRLKAPPSPANDGGEKEGGIAVRVACHLAQSERTQVWNSSGPTNPYTLKGSADRKSIDVTRHEVEECPQESMRSDTPDCADAKPPIQPANTR